MRTDLTDFQISLRYVRGCISAIERLLAGDPAKTGGVARRGVPCRLLSVQPSHRYIGPAISVYRPSCNGRTSVTALTRPPGDVVQWGQIDRRIDGQASRRYPWADVR
jgi:hypothetical protein